MKIKSKKTLVFLILLVIAKMSFAGCPSIVASNPQYMYPRTPQNYSGPVNGFHPGEPMGSNFSGGNVTSEMFKACDGDNISSGYASPVVAPVSGVKYNDGTYDFDVYPSGVSGIGYSVGITDARDNTFRPLNYPTIQTFPYPGFSGHTSFLGYNAEIVFVATGNLKPGTYTIPEQKIAQLTVSQYNGATNSDFYYATSSVIINVQSLGCNVNTTSAAIALPPVLPTIFSGVGSVPDVTASTSVGISCDAGVHVYGIMSDNSNPGNISNILSLAKESTAVGVGLQLFVNNSETAVSFGRDSSSPGIQNQFFIGDTTSQGEVVNIPIKAKYIQTEEDIKPGSILGLSTLTLSYQ